MKYALLLSLVALAGTAMYFMHDSATQSSNLRPQADSVYQAYVQWKSEFSENTNGEEDQYRFEIFKENYNFIEQFNAIQDGDLRLGTNQFAAMTVEEYSSKMLTNLPEAPEDGEFEELNSIDEDEQDADVGAPASVNWQAKGAVTAVQNQGRCGSCWAFSAKGAAEGIYKIKKGKLINLSAQQLVDCSTANHGCSGGDPIAAFSYMKSKGIERESAYPYRSGSSGTGYKCNYNKSKIVFKPKAAYRVKTGNVAAIKTASAKQPLSIEVSASSSVFQHYRSGVINTSSCGTRLNHAVLLTGYNASGKSHYWRIKNTWGTSWGSNGYALIAMTSGGAGVCGIQQYAAYPSI